ncbi:hypothetical protein GCM10010343_05740 [Streptomyces avidinii]|nr:hypothetical protein GCM10010343_05740 [Streptomyces avidinii]
MRARRRCGGAAPEPPRLKRRRGWKSGAPPPDPAPQTPAGLEGSAGGAGGGGGGVGKAAGLQTRKGPVTSYVMPPDELPLVPRWLEK